MPLWQYAFYLVFLGLFGLVFGSFANVLIWRVPRGESIVSPPSHCPTCGHEIRWYDNIPVVSWLVLGGRCRDCGTRIPARYPLVESGSAALWVLAGWRFGLAAAAPAGVLLFYLLLVLSVIDIDTRRLPTPLVAALAAVGVCAALVSQFAGIAAGPLIGVAPTGLFASPLLSAAIGLALGGGIAWAIGAVYALVRGRTGLGFGDVRLLGAIGLFLGPYVLFAYALANLLGLVGGVVALLGRDRGSREPVSIPFGPYLAAASIVTVFVGPSVWAWYLRLVGLG